MDIISTILENEFVVAMLQNEYFILLLILAGTMVFAHVFQFIMYNYVKKLTEKTKSNIDDLLFKFTAKPVYFLILLIGLYFGLRSISVYAKYSIQLDTIFFVLTVFGISYIISRIIAVFVSESLKVQKKYEKTPQLINKIVSIIIYLIAGMIILDYFQIDVTPLIATLGIGGLAVGLALQSTLSNFFAGLQILVDKPIKVGDFIELEGDISGYVEDVGWRSTRIRTLTNILIILPNSKLAESMITNLSLPVQETSLIIQCGVAYGSDLEKVEKITLQVAKEVQKKVEGAVKDFEPLVRFHTFGDSNINFSIILRIKDPESKFLVRHEFIKMLKRRFDKEKIEISWPVVKLYKGK